MDQQEPWGLLVLNELRKVPGHCANVPRNHHTPCLGCDPKNFLIGSDVRDVTGSKKID